MKILTVLAALLVTACSTQAPEPSIGDSPVHEIECPVFLAWEMCVSRATDKYCNGAESRLIRPSAEELDRVHGDGQTVSIETVSGFPAEKRVIRREITIMCER